MRVIAKSIDLIIILAVAEVLPKAGFLAGVGYMLTCDGFINGRSIGKKLVGLAVVSKATWEPCSMKDSILRNALLAVGLLFLKIPFIGWALLIAVFLIELIVLIGSSEGSRLGDEIANTAVFEVAKGKEPEAV